MVEVGDVCLRHELDRVPFWRGDHVGGKQVAEDMAKYLYLPRLRDDDVLLAAIREGVARLTWSETFAYADRWEEQQKRYLGLSAGKTIRVLLEGDSLLVKPDVAASQLAADQARPAAPTVADPAGNQGQSPTVTPSSHGTTAPVDGPVTSPPVTPVQPTRFFGSATLDPLRLARDTDRIAQERVQHLSGMDGANVKVMMEIHADIPNGAPPEVVRTVTENCRTLRFDTHGFEES